MTREKAIKLLKEYRNCLFGILAEPIDMAIKALEQEPSGDLISRQKALLSLTGEDLPKDRDKYIALVNKRIKALPSVNPQEPKVGHWIDVNNHHYYDDGDIETTELRCSCCNEVVEWDIELLHKPYYCENCGAKMIVKKESEE